MRLCFTLLLLASTAHAQEHQMDGPKWAFQWTESETPGPDLQGRWRNQRRAVQVEVHPDGRYRWLSTNEGAPRRDPCVVEGHLRHQRQTVRFFWGAADADDHTVYEEANHDRHCHFAAAVPPVRPPFARTAMLFRISDDEVALVYRDFRASTSEHLAALARDQPTEGSWAWLRLARIGSGGDAWNLSRPDGENPMRGVSLYFDGRRWGLLTVAGGTRTDAPYTLTWHRGRTQRGRLRCQGRRCRDELRIGSQRLSAYTYPAIWRRRGRDQDLYVVRRRFM